MNRNTIDKPAARPPWRSAFVAARVSHARLHPTRHAFAYPLGQYVIDLDELPTLARGLGWFAHNRGWLVSLVEGDYLEHPSPRHRAVPLKQRLAEILAAHNIDQPLGRVVLATAPRVLGYVFNPVSFYYVHNRRGALIAHVAEVNNTFYERHVYVLPRVDGIEDADGSVSYRTPKRFYVSPFNRVEGDYLFRFSRLDGRAAREADVPLGPELCRLDVSIDIEREGRTVFRSAIRGAAAPVDRHTWVGTILRYPLSAALNMPRIMWQAARLRFQRQLPVHPKPIPSHPMTLRRNAPSLFEHAATRAALAAFARIQRGSLTIRFPDGRVRSFGDPSRGERAVLNVHSWRLFARMATDSDIGFGESYTAGEWDSPDLVALMKLAIDNIAFVEYQSPVGRLAIPLRQWFRWLTQRNTPTGSRRNIRDHYDLGNSFFNLFLDPTRTYSCALFEDAEESLEQAQRNKIRRLLDRARIEPGQHILEIGSGWGALAIEAIKNYGCRVTTITLSKEQKRYVEQLAREAGVADRLKVELRDYRSMRGKFDRVVSCEMLEAVGHENLGRYFAAVDRLLKPNGLAVIQVITMPDQRHEAYRRAGDWIQKHIFPGAVIPSLTAIANAMTRHSKLMVESLENIGPHYAPTLRLWREAYEARQAEVAKLGFDEAFRRSWQYYFCYCEAAFQRRLLSDIHLVLTRPCNPTLDRAPVIAPISLEASTP